MCRGRGEFCKVAHVGVREGGAERLGLGLVLGLGGAVGRGAWGRAADAVVCAEGAAGRF